MPHYAPLMRWLITPILLFSLLMAGSSFAADTVTGKVIKVLPQYLDLKGRTSIAPSLYERDSYQSQLLKNPALRSGIVFNICSRASKELKLIVEARGVMRGKSPSLVVIEKNAPLTGRFGKWSKIAITGDDYKNIETLTAWHVSLWDGDSLVSEYKSFLW